MPTPPMLMGAAQVLQKHRKELRGTVRLLFQPAEEQCEGAKVMLEQGALDGVDAIFGFHIGTLLGADIPQRHRDCPLRLLHGGL